MDYTLTFRDTLGSKIYTPPTSQLPPKVIKIIVSYLDPEALQIIKGQPSTARNCRNGGKLPPLGRFGGNEWIAEFLNL